MSASPTQDVATSLAVGDRFRLDCGKFGRRPVIISVDRCLSFAGHGVFASGWLVDPAGEVAGLRIEVAHRQIEPLAEGYAVARPDALASLGTALRRAPALDPSEARPGFARFVKGLAEPPDTIRTILELKGGDVHVFETPVDETLDETLAFVRDAGWPVLAAQLPESAAELPIVWRDALYRMLWLTDDNSSDAAELSEYLRGESRPPAREGKVDGPSLIAAEHSPEPVAPPTVAPEPLAFESATNDSEDSEPLIGEPVAADASEMDQIRESGLFDAEQYLERNPDVSELEISPLEHFCTVGWREGRSPNAGFDPAWYLKEHADVAESGLIPLWHYIVQGEGEGRWPHPLFDPDFYRERYSVPEGASPLADYLAKSRLGEWRDPVELFDASFYLEENPDVAEAGEDPLFHYVSVGHTENRDPSPRFDTAYYRGKYLQDEPDSNPLIHYYASDVYFRPHTRPGAHDLDEGIAAQVRKWVNPGDGYEYLDPTIAAGKEAKAKVMAFYLPQFHAIPENDEWWGKGFTEWRNVMRGLPRYAGHFQPRVPRDLGFYDLSNPRVLHQQTALAQQAGLHSFCFHYYWFNGKRLLERPLDNFLADPSIDFPFSVAWANENWTRRWDGMENEVLLRQDYKEEDDEALVDDLQRYFSDPRYVRIDGRPILMIYRVDIFPDARPTFDRWRRLWESRHGERPLIFLAQTFGIRDPRDYDLDGAVEFPPHKVTETSHHVDVRLLDSNFRGNVFDYGQIVEDSLGEPHPDFPLIKTAVPSWDNDARRQGTGVVLDGATPQAYERWLRGLIDHANRHPVYGENFVCVNAWNEWAEAAYLEPDVHYGGAYLNATARAICGETKLAGPPPRAVAAPPARSLPDPPQGESMKVLMVGHDAHPFGAQRNLLHMAKSIKNQFGCEVGFLLRSGGELVAAYEELGEVRVTEDAGADEHGQFVDADPGLSDAALTAVDGFSAAGYDIALANTTATGRLVPYLKEAGFRVVSLIHELPRLIEEYGMREALERIAERSDKIVFAADAVRDAFREGIEIPEEKIVVRPQGLYSPIQEREGSREAVRAELGIPADARIVLNVGSGDFRKGIDIFLSIAKLAGGSNLHFVWVGQLNKDSRRWLRADMQGDLARRVHLVDHTNDVAPYFRAADVFFLSSREDPFPSVVLEAMEVGLPVVALSDSGGIVDLVAEHGRVLDRNDLDGLLVMLDELSSPDGDSEHDKEERARSIRARFAWDDYCFTLLQLLDPSLKKISVAVPSYNYREYLKERLESIIGQTYPVFEVIVLDDCSTDGSLDELRRIEAHTHRLLQVVPGETNSGSAFRQWAKASELARGDFLWIAEADDTSLPRFLRRMAPSLDSDEVAFAFSDSAQIDEKGAPIGTSYGEYYRQSAGDAMETDFVMGGKDFVITCLAERNLVLNVSSVVWNRAVLADQLESSVDDLLGYKLAGDWHLYIAAALSGRQVAYVAEPLNVHRRHEVSVTGSLGKERHLDEVARVHERIAEWLRADSGTLERMEAYRAELGRQFGLSADV